MASPSPAANLREAVPGLRRTLRRFRPHLRRQRTVIAGGSAALFVEVLLRLAEPWPLKFIIDTIVKPAGQPGAVDSTTVVAVAAVSVVAITGLRALASYLCTIAFAIAGNRVLTEVRAEVYAHLQRLCWPSTAGPAPATSSPASPATSAASRR